jgi:hypothetical protein
MSRSKWHMAVLIALPCSCAGVTEPGECPSTVVSVADSGIDPLHGQDGGPGVFAAIGDQNQDEPCFAFCPQDRPVCQLIDGTHVKCQAGCE